MYLLVHALSTKINNVMLFPYQLKDAYESTSPQHTSTLHEVNITITLLLLPVFMLRVNTFISSYFSSKPWNLDFPGSEKC